MSDAIESRFRETAILYDAQSILAFAVGKPSEAFGERTGVRRWAVHRPAARPALLVPGPGHDGQGRALEDGGRDEAVAEYDVPPDAWYFAADRQERMPFAVLLEVALQPCGWLAAYMGSALTSDGDAQVPQPRRPACQHAAVDAADRHLRPRSGRRRSPSRPG